MNDPDMDGREAARKLYGAPDTLDQTDPDSMLGDDPLDRKINKAAVTRAWILRHPYYNYRHAPPDADAEEYARRQSELQETSLSHLLN